MAIKPVSNEAFYREVDEELRRDQLAGTWKRYGWLIVGGVVLLLAIVGGVIWWQNEKRERAGRQGETLVGVFEDVQKRPHQLRSARGSTPWSRKARPATAPRRS